MDLLGDAAPEPPEQSEPPAPEQVLDPPTNPVTAVPDDVDAADNLALEAPDATTAPLPLDATNEEPL